MECEDEVLPNVSKEDVENNPNIMNAPSDIGQIKLSLACERDQVQSPKDLINVEGISGEDSALKSNEILETEVSTSTDIDHELEDAILHKKNKKSRISAMLDSDSEGEEEKVSTESSKPNADLYNLESESDMEDTVIKSQKKKLKRIALIDSDSDEENDTKSNENCTQNKDEEMANNSTVFVVNNGKLVPEEIMQSKNPAKILSNLCDEESSDDNSDANNEDNDEDDQGISDNELDALQCNVIIPPKSRKGRINRPEKPQKMTAKKALEQKKEILSESQRRVRESRLSLPYHKPKPKSLKEFLQNRTKLAAPLSDISVIRSPSAAIKMSLEQLTIVSKKLKEREKEMEQFYKSESESDNEETPNDVEDSEAGPSEIVSDPMNEIITNDAQEGSEHENKEKEVTLKDDTSNQEEHSETLHTTAIINEVRSVDKKIASTEKLEENCSMTVNMCEQKENAVSNFQEKSQVLSEAEKVVEMQIDELKNAQVDPKETTDGESVSPDDFSNQEQIEVDQNEGAETGKIFEASKIENKDDDDAIEKEEENTSANKNVAESLCNEIGENGEANDAMDTTEYQKTLATDGDFDGSLKNRHHSQDDKSENEDETDQNDPKVSETDTVNENKDDVINNAKDSNETEKTNKLLILSDIVLKPGEEENPKDIYNLDAELLELASEAKSDNNRYSDNYEFNLDDIEDESEQVLRNTDEPENAETVDANQLKKLKRRELLEKLTECKPRLSGGPNQLIDLENGIAVPDEVSKLRERFFQHNMKTGKNKHNKEISILSVTNGKIHKETLNLNDDEEEEEDTAPIEKPGVRLQKLREELQDQIAKRRSQAWKEKVDQTSKNKEENEEESGGEKSDYEIDNILDNDEEEEMTESEEEGEEDLEENDCDMSEKKKKKSKFVEEEAEESETEVIDEDETPLNEDAEIEDDEQIEELNEEMEEDEENAAEVGDDEDEKEETEDVVPKKKVLKRIIKPFDNDESDDEEETNSNNLMFGFALKKRDKEASSDDEYLPLHQPTNYKIREPVVTPTKSEVDFLTPVTFMTGLKNLNTSGSRITTEISPEKKGSLASPKNLFTDAVDGVESQVSEEFFPTTQEILDKVDENEKSQICPSSDISKQNDSQENFVSTQDVLEICSGEFPSSSKSTSSPEISVQQLREIFTGTDSDVQKSSDDFNTQDLAEICSGKFTGVSQAEIQQDKDIALDDKDEHLISQVIDEEELERFKKKFESPMAPNTQKTRIFKQDEEVQGTGGVLDSDEEDENELVLKKKKRKRLAFSDDEDSCSDVPPEETIDLQDTEDITSDIEYDSEENEIDPEQERIDREERKREFPKASEFFENEAELSESEWDSEDEDERNLDDMEFEKGDEEKFDDDELRTDIEKIQMRQMLDEDNREVKLLQELLLEDGELHGSGRQRQFRWKNIDGMENDVDEKKDDDGDVYLDDDHETEEQYRKMRHEREMFMMKKQSQDDDDDSLIIESQRLSFTHKSLKIKSQTSILSQTFSLDAAVSPKVKQPFSLLNKRGSFLSRSDQILQKLAETSKVSIGTKNTNRIVFQAVNDEDQKKRKASSSEVADSTPVALKKLRLSGLSPALKKEKPKVGKSLFSNISID